FRRIADSMTTEINPYESPRQPSHARTHSERASLVFFLVNFGAAVTLGLFCIFALVESFTGEGSPFALLGGLFCLGPCLFIAIGEWVFLIQKHQGLGRLLGATCGAAAALSAFGFIANVSESLAARDSPPIAFWLIFALICFAITSYGLI